MTACNSESLRSVQSATQRETAKKADGTGTRWRLQGAKAIGFFWTRKTTQASWYVARACVEELDLLLACILCCVLRFSSEHRSAVPSPWTHSQFARRAMLAPLGAGARGPQRWRYGPAKAVNSKRCLVCILGCRVPVANRFLVVPGSS